MTSFRPLTRYVGEAERTLQALLRTQIGKAGLSFPEWTVLTFLNGAGSLAREQLVDALGNGWIVDRNEANALIEAMIDSGLVASADAGLSITKSGAELYLPIRSAVEDMTAKLVDGISANDLEATRRTLDEVTRRATRLLPAGAD